MRWVLVGIVVLLVRAVLPAVATAEQTPQWTVEFDRRVTGDVMTVGNTVVGCPPGPVAVACHLMAGGAPVGPEGENDRHRMVWTDVDGRRQTYNSSTARVDVPAGGRIRHATLTWGGDLGDGDWRCSRGEAPPGNPGTQPVTMIAGGEVTRLPPERFRIQRDPARPGLDRWYSAHADVTAAMRNLRGRVDVTVGNVWTPQGHGCVGGWSLVVVWEAEGAPPRHVTVYSGHERIRPGEPAGIRLRDADRTEAMTLGVTAFEGDLGLVGDTIAVDGRRQGPRYPASAVNAFVADAQGAVDPMLVSNLGVDAKDLRIAPGPGGPAARATGGVEVGLTTPLDDYLVATLALSSAGDRVPDTPPSTVLPPPTTSPTSVPPSTPPPPPEPEPAPAEPTAEPTPEPTAAEPTTSRAPAVVPPPPAPPPPAPPPPPQAIPPPPDDPALARQAPVPVPEYQRAPRIAEPAAVPDNRDPPAGPAGPADPADRADPVHDDRSGPLATPARTAAVIAALAVFVMIVTVAALGSVVRLRR